MALHGDKHNFNINNSLNMHSSTSDWKIMYLAYIESGKETTCPLQPYTGVVEETWVSWTALIMGLDFSMMMYLMKKKHKGADML